jgi:menaquinone-dependent protoporphyrinogen oxidase
VAGTLVAYATNDGSTREVAEALAEALREAGLQTDVRPARAPCDLAAYDTVVLGAPLYRGLWHGDALGFLKRHCERLANRDVAIFALRQCTPVCEGGCPRCRAQLAAGLHQVTWLNPVSVALFGGVDGAMRRGEHRYQCDRGAVRAWAASLAETTVRAAAGF